MALQSQVNTALSLGVAGAEVNPGQTIFTPVNPLAETAVTVGNFCFEGTDPYSQVKAGGSVVKGFVMRVQQYANYAINSAGTLTVNVGDAVSCAVKGSFYAVSSTVATEGQAVFADTTTGAISTGTAGSSVSGAIETGYVVKKGGAVGEPIVISNWE